MLTLIAELGQLASQALAPLSPDAAAVPAELPVQPAARAEFGDLQIAACLQLAKPLGRKPRDLAALVQAAVAAHPAVGKTEIAGPGYVNIFLRDSWLVDKAVALSADPTMGLRPVGAGQCVVVDFSAPNIAKPMHIGHIRSTIIGDALQRVMRALGYQVIADNHLGDWGTQFGKLIVAYRRWLDRPAYTADPIAELVRLYQKFVSDEAAEALALGINRDRRRAAEDEDSPAAEAEAAAKMDEGEKAADAPAAAPAQAEAAPAQADAAQADDAPAQVTPLLQEARAELAKLQQGDPDNLALWREFVTVSLAEFNKSYVRLGVRFDVQLGESYYNPRLQSLVEELLAQGIAERSRGAVICPVEGEPAPLLIRKGDGSYLYGTTDLATVEHRVRTWRPVRILYVVGAPQQLHFRQIFAIARKMGVTCSLEHIWFGSLRFWDAERGKWAAGSTRKGNVAQLDVFLDEAQRRAEAVARQKNDENPEPLSEDELREVARVVGLGAVKYNDLSRDRVGDINFDLETALKLDGNTAPYVQYAYARMRSIGRKAQVEPTALQDAPLHLHQPEERALLRRVLDYPAAVEQVARTTKPHLLTEYLYSLAGSVSTFYQKVPVLKAEPAERLSRLRLLDIAARTLQSGLSLLGIEVRDRM